MAEFSTESWLGPEGPGEPDYENGALVYRLGDDDTRKAIRNELARLGLTFDELAGLSRSRFQTEAQRRAWFVIKDLRHLA